MVVKFQKSNFCCIYALFWILSNGVKDTPLQQFYLGSLNLFDSIFSGIVWIDQMEEFISLTIVAMETAKSHSFSYHVIGYWEMKEN